MKFKLFSSILALVFVFSACTNLLDDESAGGIDGGQAVEKVTTTVISKEVFEMSGDGVVANGNKKVTQITDDIKFENTNKSYDLYFSPNVGPGTFTLYLKKGGNYYELTYNTGLCAGEVFSFGMSEVSILKYGAFAAPYSAPINVIVSFQGFYGFGIGVYGIEVEIAKGENKEIDIDWDAVYDAYVEKYALYADAYPSIIGQFRWVDATNVEGWQSSGIISEFFEGATPTITLNWDMLEQYCEAGGTLVICLEPEGNLKKIEPVIANVTFAYYKMIDDIPRVFYFDIKDKVFTIGANADIDWTWVLNKYEELYAESVISLPEDIVWRSSGQPAQFFPGENPGAILLTESMFMSGTTTICFNPGYVIAEPVIEPVVVNLGFIGYYMNNDKVLSTSFYWQNLEEGQCVDWNAVDAAYAEWIAKGGLEPNRENGWKTSGYAPLYFDDYESICQDFFTPAQLESYYLSYYVNPGYVIKEQIEKVELVFASAKVTSYSTNLQNANNGNLKFTVTVTMSDGSTYDVDHAEKVSGGQKGNKTFNYGDYSVKAVWNDNNNVTSVEVL